MHERVGNITEPSRVNGFGCQVQKIIYIYSSYNEAIMPGFCKPWPGTTMFLGLQQLQALTATHVMFPVIFEALAAVTLLKGINSSIASNGIDYFFLLSQRTMK